MAFQASRDLKTDSKEKRSDANYVTSAFIFLVDRFNIRLIPRGLNIHQSRGLSDVPMSGIRNCDRAQIGRPLASLVLANPRFCL